MLNVGLVAIGSTDEAYVWTGGQYYLQHLVKCVAALPPQQAVVLRDVWWMAMAKTDPFKEVRSVLGEPVVVSPPSTPAGRLMRKLRRLWAAADGAGDLFRQRGIDVFFPSPPCEKAGVPHVFWIPDFQHVRRPDLMAEAVRARFERDVARGVAGASRIVLSSYDAQRDFAAMFPDRVASTHVVRFCSVPDASWWSQDPMATAGRYGLPERFLIVCNQFTRHKNHLVLLQAMRLLAAQGRNDIHLVCTGSTYDYREEDYVGQVRAFAAEHGLDRNVSILGLVPRDEQVALLRRAVAVLQPSQFEGWSTLVEDAKTLGKATVVSDLPVHREQLGAAHANYIAPDSAQQWADAIGALWSSAAPGPDIAAEQAAAPRVEAARVECGLAFVQALAAAVQDSHA